MATYKLLAPAIRAYALTGTDRAGSTSYTATTHYLEFRVADRGGKEVCLPPNQDITILSARLISGVPGIVAGDRPAAFFNFVFGTQDDCDLDETLVEVPISLVEWNRSEKQVKSISASVLAATTPIFVFIKSGSSYNVMDYNVQDDWVGQEFEPMIELIIETDHLLTVDGEVFH